MDQNVKIYCARQSYIGVRSAKLVSFSTSTFLAMSTLHGIDVLHFKICSCLPVVHEAEYGYTGVTSNVV